MITDEGFVKGLNLNLQDGVLKYIREKHGDGKLMCRGCGEPVTMSSGVHPGQSFSFISELHTYSEMLFMHVTCRKCTEAISKFLQGLNHGKTSQGAA